MRCSFCQGPKFVKKPHKISIDSIDRVLRFYKKIGINEVAVADESFGLFKEHSRRVVELFNKYHFYWTALTRVDLTVKNFDDWMKKGLSCVLLGIESFNQEILDKISKEENITQTIRLIKKINRLNRLAIGYYIIGFEDDTVQSIKNDMMKLKKLDMFLCHVNVLAPLPKTELWNDLDGKYGIFEKNYHHWDNQHLVFHHPYLTQSDIDKILPWCHKILYPRRKILKMIKTLVARYYDAEHGLVKGFRYMFRQQWVANNYDFSINQGKIFSEDSSMDSLAVERIYSE